MLGVVYLFDGCGGGLKFEINLNLFCVVGIVDFFGGCSGCFGGYGGGADLK